MKKIFSIILSLALAATSCVFAPLSASAEDTYSYADISRACVHDPSVVKSEDGKYYVFGSHIAAAESDDLINWTNLDTTIDNEYDNILAVDGKSWKENLAEPLAWTTAYQELQGVSEEDMAYACWASDVIYNEAMGKYCMYACCSNWGVTASVIFLATSDDIEGPYEYSDCLVYSGFNNIVSPTDSNNAINYRKTNVMDLVDKGYVTESELKKNSYPWFTSSGSYNCAYGEFPNAIDPTAFTDENGDMWLVYGSYSGGCYVMPLIEETGLPDYDYMYSMSQDSDSGYDLYFGKQVSCTNAESEGTGEGPFIIYDSISGYYYFFLTYGGLAGEGGYNIREYRSESPDGPYVDAEGKEATADENTGLKLDGNYQFTTQKTAYLSGGHSSVLIDDDGTMYQVYHTRFSSDSGQGHQVRVHQMLRTSDGWAVMLPYEYQGETVEESGYDSSEIVGTYEFIDSTNMTQRLADGETDLSTIILPTQCIKLNSDGTITGAKDYSCSITNANTGSTSVSGTWTADGDTYTATFKIGSVTYSGVFCKQKDETSSATEVMTFSGAGDDNSTIWGVEHTEHTYTTVTTKATTSKNGSKKSVCSFCGATNPSYTATTIYYPKTVTLSATSYTYSGDARKPSVTVKDSKGNKISSSNYTVSYSNNKKVGKATATIKFKGNYSGTIKKTFKIKPKSTSLKSLTKGSKKITVKWNKQATQTTGYQIQYSTSSSFKNAKTVTVKSNKTTSKTIKSLKGKKKYYVRIRTYKTVSGTKYYSSWSKAKSVTTKK